MCVARAGGAKRTRNNPNTTQPGLGVDLRRMNGAALAASPVPVVDRIVTPPFMKEAGNWASPREFGRPGRKGSRVRGFKGPRGFAHKLPFRPRLASPVPVPCSNSQKQAKAQARHRQGSECPDADFMSKAGPRVSDCESNAGTPADSDSNP